MTPKLKTNYICQNCGYVSPRWTGKCPSCEQWNTLIETIVESKKTKSNRESSVKNVQARIQPLHHVIHTSDGNRTASGIAELDRVLGGGIVQGSVMLIGGDPGIGKSTLMLQIAGNLKNKKLLYVSGEESPSQIKMRADRLGLTLENFLVLPETSLDVVASAIESESPDFVVIDSIQTVYIPELESSPGTISQLRESTALLIKTAKSTNIPVFIVGHITKDGTIAGPKSIEHMVDVVLQFEGERTHFYRVLRGIKNRFGSTNEIGIFEMTEKGLKEVPNPSEVFLSQRNYGASGCVISSAIEGTRPILIEVQALVCTTSYGVPQRTAMGFDYKRLNILIAVIEKKLGIYLNKHDIFLNIAGGVKIDETAVDLAAAMSIYSSYRDIPVDSETVIMGEVGLAGEIRTISSIEKRINEAEKLGFKKIILPKNNIKNLNTKKYKIQIIGVERIKEAASAIIN
ncbi:MAG: DNA repair protein RadA [Ignavibacteria bacterium]|nr:DNA repair protein RadA [Ignavibacteria bacterium]